MDNELRGNVQRMIDAGVPEDKIGAYIQKYTANPPVQKVQVVEPQLDHWRGVAESAGSALGTLVGGGGAAVLGQLGPQAATPEEVFTVPAAATAGGALGGAIGGQMYDIGKSVMSGRGLPLPGQQQDRAIWDVALGGSVPLLAGKALETGARAGKNMFSPVKSYLKRAVGPVGAEGAEQLSRMEARGFKPEVGMLSNPEAQNLSQSLRQMPASGRVMGEIDAHNVQRGAELADEVARSIGRPMAKTEVGGAVRDSMYGKRETFFKGAKVLYDRVNEFVPDNVPANNVMRVVVGAMDELDSSALSQQYLKGIRETVAAAGSDIAEDGTMPKTALARIKQMAKNAYAKAPKDRTDVDNFMMQLERAADSDMNEAAIKYGGEAGEKAVERAKTWWKIGMSDNHKGKVGLLDDVQSVLKQSEEGKIYNWIMAEDKDGHARIRRVLNAVDNNTADSIRATALKEMGRPTPGAAAAGGDGFSFSTFLTNYNKLAPEARETLFGKASEEMKGLLEVSEFMRALQKRANTSNTAAMNVWNHLLDPVIKGFTTGGAISGPVSALKGATFGMVGQVGQLAVNNRTAQLMTDPQFVRWLATTGKQIVVSPQSAGPQVARLIQIAASAPEEQQPAYNDYLRQLGVPLR